MTPIDLTDVYFDILILSHHRKNLCFAVGKRIYQYHLPFRYSLASCIFYILTIINIYINNSLILAKESNRIDGTREEVEEAHTILVIQHIILLGFIFTSSKSALKLPPRLFGDGPAVRSVLEVKTPLVTSTCWRSDNTTGVAYLNRQGCIRSLPLHKMVVSILT